jgi:two-component system, chemotaxis family, protein-glutamate methylesterase/glutaminase
MNLTLPHAVDAVVIGASSGGIDVLGTLLPALQRDYPLPVAVVLHVPPDRRSLLVEVFAYRCAVRLKEVDDKDKVERGVVYFAPPDYHLLFEDRNSFSLSVDDPVNHSRPSIDVLFQSAADVFGARVLGILCSGSNQDGAVGLSAICAAGGVAAVQDVRDATSPEMPAAGLQACPTALVHDAKGLAQLLRNAGGKS